MLHPAVSARKALHLTAVMPPCVRVHFGIFPRRVASQDLLRAVNAQEHIRKIKRAQQTQRGKGAGHTVANVRTGFFLLFLPRTGHDLPNKRAAHRRDKQ